MSIAATLSSALSGLNAATRQAEVVASNIANATNENYARREVQISARDVGGSGQGVKIDGIRRAVDTVLTSDRRLAQAGTGDREARAAFFGKLEAAIGTPESEGSLGQRIGALDTALLEATARPDSEARLSAVADAARNLTGALGNAARSVQDMRASADARIGTDVDMVNASLVRIAELNGQIRGLGSAGRDPSALMDQRQELVDRIAAVLPLREQDREYGQIALYTSGGAVLLEGRPVELGFTRAGTVTADMTLASGGLSGLTINGRAVATSGPQNPFAGGSLAAAFAVRDELAPAAQARLDAVARDLVTRFSPGPDTTVAPGAPGLFTDAGAAFAPANEVGLAQRLRINAAADPAQGGALWRLRDGMGATVQGATGNSALLSGLQQALTAPRATATGAFQPGSRSLSGLAAELISGVSTARVSADSEASFASARSGALRDMELQGGVDTDREMQDLLQIEKYYAANAKVIQTVDSMIKLLLEL